MAWVAASSRASVPTAFWGEIRVSQRLAFILVVVADCSAGSSLQDQTGPRRELPGSLKAKTEAYQNEVGAYEEKQAKKKNKKTGNAILIEEPAADSNFR